MSDLRVRNHGADDVRVLTRDLLDVYEKVYGDRLDDPFFATDRYGQRVYAYASREGFAMTTGWIGDQLIGYAMGYRLPANTGWWQGLLTAVDPQLTRETGTRTFALNEIMVLAEHRRRGYAQLMHDQLLITRPLERRATLLVEQDNEAAIAAYQSWGYQTIGQLQPFGDAPVYHAMIKDPL
jgi:ribosomal protein S18 acetylase RimI-like enzyme